MKNPMSEKFKNSLEFVTKHYRQGAFRASLLFAPVVSRPWWRTRAAAASAACAAVLVASAAYYFLNIAPAKSPELPAAPDATEATAPAAIAEDVKRIEFTDAPLARVAREIEEVYGVTVSGVPADTTLHLTLSYEGTAADLTATINELLDTHLTIEAE